MADTKLTHVDIDVAQATPANVRLTQVDANAAQPAIPNLRLAHVEASIAQVPPAANLRFATVEVVLAVPNIGPSRLSSVELVVAVPNINPAAIQQVGTGARLAPAMLLDILTANGNTYFWSSHEWDQFPPALSSTPVKYRPYLVSVGPFTLTRSLRTDAGQITVQNLSGNTIERDVLKALRSDEFEGAFAIFRIWDFVVGTRFEFHGTLRLQSASPTQVQFQLNQLLDATLQDIPQRVFSNLCTWTYKSDVCGSTGTATTCPKSAAACKDPRRDAFPRFNGVVTGPQLTEISSVQYQQQPPVSAQQSRRVNL